MTSTFTYTSEFHQEFEAETASLLRSRFLWFAGIAAGLALVQLGLRLSILVQSRLLQEATAADAINRVGAVHDAATVLLYLGIIAYVLTARPQRHILLRLSTLCIVLDGVLDIAAEPVFGTPGAGILRTMVAHSLAAALLPWSTRQAIAPMVPLLILNALSWVIFASFSVGGLIGILLTPLAAGPGIALAYTRHMRRTQSFKLRFLQSRYGMIRRELVDARRIHESLFPNPMRSGALRFDYRYEPMLQIGGDYLYARFSPPRGGEPPAFNMILIDVTGHGIAAALTVNRLYGEVERLFAEDPQARPGEVLRALNRYVHLTLAKHSVFVTALCVRIEMGRNLLEYASGGHPPAFLRAVDGTLDELQSTALVLGACSDSEFDPAPEQRPFGPGDTLVAYTDGAIEARDESGRVLGIKAIQRILASGKPDPAGVAVGVGGWVTAILAAVDEHRLGPPTDDTIVVEVTRPLVVEPEGRRRGEARAEAGVGSGEGEAAVTGATG